MKLPSKTNLTSKYISDPYNYDRYYELTNYKDPLTFLDCIYETTIRINKFHCKGKSYYTGQFICGYIRTSETLVMYGYIDERGRVVVNHLGLYDVYYELEHFDLIAILTQEEYQDNLRTNFTHKDFKYTKNVRRRLPKNFHCIHNLILKDYDALKEFLTEGNINE